ncbi:hypothetical protein BN1723_014864, partial [Verticillium longisporum]
MNGFDSSLMGAINAMPQYQESFGLSGAGSTTGIVFMIYNVGQVVAFPFCGWLADGYGRRICIFVGCAIVLIGTAIQTPATSLGMFIGGRFVLGFGASIASAAGPAYTVELAHPAYRGFMAGMYNNFWWLGNILAGWTTYGSNLHLDNSWAWRTPTVIQAGLPGIVMALILFFPESPRWLISHDRAEEALAILAKYHGDGNANAPVVQLQYHEIVEDNKLTKDENPWWDYRELVNTRAARYRLFMVIAMSFIGQWSGNNVVSYFMPEMIKQAGITNTDTQLLLNAINPIFSMIAAIYGASLLDKLGRRKMMLAGLSEQQQHPLSNMATHEETKPHFEHEEPLAGKEGVGKVTEVNATSVALAAAMAEQKPNIWSANMIRLYMIMGIGYLVSTMNGF